MIVVESAAVASGIYCILNRETGECYVGKATDIKARIATHFQALKKGTHHSGPLQASYNRCGRQAFAVDVLEYCEVADLDPREHLWMLKAKPAFNVMRPDYAAVAKGIKPDGRLRRRKDPVCREPSRYLCSCGGLKSPTSRGCLHCLKRLCAEMVATGYLPAEHSFELASLQPR